MTENGLFVLGGPETHLYDIFGPFMTEKFVVEARARKISGTSRLRWVVGAERCTFILYTYARGCEALGSN